MSEKSAWGIQEVRKYFEAELEKRDEGTKIILATFDELKEMIDALENRIAKLESQIVKESS